MDSDSRVKLKYTVKISSCVCAAPEFLHIQRPKKLKLR